ncbi:MAG: NAD(P)/FAD-dependent oxidoreductase, partial [Cyclobacteriaceae bacterium]|nr:NAD(P)/FAD-dependent oxidoreductase [Cyclobacteriaceae bacterium]
MDDQRIISNLIIGAGPAGLAVAGRMRLKQIPFKIIEASDLVACSWHQHYDRLCLHTVSELSHLPGLPFPDDFPRYVPKDALIKYYNQYVNHFDITPIFHQNVVRIEKDGNLFLVKTADGNSYHTENVIVATGANRVPRIPHWPGQESFAGTIIHSRNYQNTVPFHNQRVLVVGMANTGAEIALDLAEQNITILLSVRGPVSIVPRDLNGRPTQVTARLLEKIPFGWGDQLGNLIRLIYIGSLEKYGLTASRIPPAIQLKKTGKTPVIDIGTVQKIKEGKIKVIPDIKTFTKDGVEDTEGRLHKINSVILATGYKAQLDNFLFDTTDLLDQYDVPKSPIG